MDSLSQIVLGTTVSLLVTGGRQPKKAILYGAVFGTLPDLDVFVPSINDLTATIEHRTWSHSWIVMSLVSPLFALGIYWKDKSLSYLRWLTLIWLIFITHSALDAFTIYGTDIFWPISNETIMGASVFIIDPFFTLPLLIVTIVSRKHNKSAKSIHRQATIALSFSGAYLLWGVYAQSTVQNIAIQSLKTPSFQEQSRSHQHLVATPTPFNSILWRVLVMEEDQYHEGFYSFLDKNPVINFQSYPRNKEIIDLLEPQSNWQKFNHFAHGYTKAEKQHQTLTGTDLRMGAQTLFFFRFRFAELENGQVLPLEPNQLDIPMEGLGLLKQVWFRIWSEDGFN